MSFSLSFNCLKHSVNRRLLVVDQIHRSLNQSPFLDLKAQSFHVSITSSGEPDRLGNFPGYAYVPCSQVNVEGYQRHPCTYRSSSCLRELRRSVIRFSVRIVFDFLFKASYSPLRTSAKFTLSGRVAAASYR